MQPFSFRPNDWKQKPAWRPSAFFESSKARSESRLCIHSFVQKGQLRSDSGWIPLWGRVFYTRNPIFVGKAFIFWEHLRAVLKEGASSTLLAAHTGGGRSSSAPSIEREGPTPGANHRPVPSFFGVGGPGFPADFNQSTCQWWKNARMTRGLESNNGQVCSSQSVKLFVAFDLLEDQVTL